jgi:hypothetical protein
MQLVCRFLTVIRDSQACTSSAPAAVIGRNTVLIALTVAEHEHRRLDRATVLFHY